jgi:hypothetical protein
LIAEGVVEVLAVVAGLTLVLATASDAVSTLVTTRRRPGRFWPTPVFYRQTWRAWMAVGRRARPELREGFLGIYGPLSLLGLLMLWVLLLVAGWGAVWWGLRSRTSGIDGYIDAVYFAGVGFLTVGFGDIVPTGDLARLLVLVEAFMGLVTMALVIGYLPTLYGAYSRREVQLLALDDLSDEAATPLGFLEACHGSGGAEAVAAMFAEWERWCDDVYDSHTAYPDARPVPLPAAGPALADRTRGGDGRGRHLRGHDRHFPGWAGGATATAGHKAGAEPPRVARDRGRGRRAGGLVR